MKVLVTGAAGRLGRMTCGMLKQAGYEVHAVDRITKPDVPVRIEICELDQVTCYRLLDGKDAVVHLANDPSAFSKYFHIAFTENVTVNANIFHAASEVGVKKIVFASSIQVMNGRRIGRDVDQPSCLPYLPIDSNMPANTGYNYALGKRVSEVALKHFSDITDWSAFALRFPLLLDERRRKWGAHMKGIPDPKKGLPYWARLDEAFTCLPMRDAVRLIEACLETDLPGYHCYLPGARFNQFNWSSKKLIEKFYQAVPLRKPIEALDSLVDITQITEETGWEPVEPSPYDEWMK